MAFYLGSPTVILSVAIRRCGTLRDRNLQLSTGAVFAFGLIRGLAIVEYITVDGQQWVDMMIAIAPVALLSIAESIILFAPPAILLNIAFQQGWIKRFSS
ncbi:MAG: hypothetical protein WBA77_16495 [Microcoleaceae cyanobacterium]